MGRSTIVLCALCALGSIAAAADAKVVNSGQGISGVQKVIQMLTDMQAKGRQDKNDEQVAFAKFTTWCTEKSASLKSEIAKNAEDIELLDTEIMKLASEIKELGEAIAELTSGVEDDQATIKAETATRSAANKAFLAEEQDYSESVSALERAVAVMKKQNYDRPATAAALLQLTSADSNMPQQAKSVIATFLQSMGASASEAKELEDPMDYAAPEANAYEFQSSSIVTLLKKLRDEFRAKLGTCQKEEQNSVHAFNMIVQDLTDSIENAQKDIEEKTKEKERKSGKKALNQKQMASTEEVKAKNEDLLKAMTTECSEKQLSFEEKQRLRTEELQAIAKAIEIVGSPDVSGNADKHLELVQQKSGSALVQKSDDSAFGDRRKTRDFLLSEGNRLKSNKLVLLSQKIGADPFAKVKSLIDSMITRLLEEANADADHEGFCDTEMGKSKITRNRLNQEIDGLSAAVEDGKATILALSQSTTQLSKEIEELIADMTEATDLRKAEKAKNAQTVEDAQAAQAAVTAATAVLKDFYDKALTATGFLQTAQARNTPQPRGWGLKMGVKMGSEEWNELANPNFESKVTQGSEGQVDTGHKEGMQTFGESTTGMQDRGNGVLALLELIQSDFANLEADTTAAEAASTKAYDDFMTESKKNHAVKARKVEMNNADQAAAEAKLATDIADLKATQDELIAADKYHAKLVPQCIDQGMTFEERTSAREEEISSLKKALEILGSPDIATSA